jgi:hypothetical protein
MKETAMLPLLPGWRAQPLAVIEAKREREEEEDSTEDRTKTRTEDRTEDPLRVSLLKYIEEIEEELAKYKNYDIQYKGESGMVNRKIILREHVLEMWKSVLEADAPANSPQWLALWADLLATRLKPVDKFKLPISIAFSELPFQKLQRDKDFEQLVENTQKNYVENLIRSKNDVMKLWQSGKNKSQCPWHRVINNHLLRRARDGKDEGVPEWFSDGDSNPAPSWFRIAQSLYDAVVNAPRLQVFALLARGVRARPRLPTHDFQLVNKSKMRVGETVRLATFLSCANASTGSVYCSHGPAAVEPSCNLPPDDKCPQMELLIAPGTPMLAFFLHESDFAHENELLLPPGVKLTYLGTTGDEDEFTLVEQYLVTP